MHAPPTLVNHKYGKNSNNKYFSFIFPLPTKQMKNFYLFFFPLLPIFKHTKGKYFIFSFLSLFFPFRFSFLFPFPSYNQTYCNSIFRSTYGASHACCASNCAILQSNTRTNDFTIHPSLICILKHYIMQARLVTLTPGDH